MNSLRLRRASASALRRWRASRRASRSGSAGLSAVSDRVPDPASDSSPPNRSLSIRSIFLASLVSDRYGDPTHHPITSGGPHLKASSSTLTPTATTPRHATPRGHPAPGTRPYALGEGLSVPTRATCSLRPTHGAGYPPRGALWAGRWG